MIQQRHEFCLVIGAQKAGTTSLYATLRDHPEICVTKVKESDFFYKDDLYDHGIDHYLSLFPPKNLDQSVYLDVDPDLLLYDSTPKRIYDTLGPKTKFILLLRNPVDRALSHHAMQVYRGLETQPFLKAIELEEDRIKTKDGKFHFSYLHRGKYHSLLTAYLEWFPLSQFRCYIFETDFLQNRAGMFADICEFLSLQRVDLDNQIERNRTKKIRNKAIDRLYNSLIIKKIIETVFPQRLVKKLDFTVARWNSKETDLTIDSIVRSQLIHEVYEKEVQQIETLFQKDLSHWT